MHFDCDFARENSRFSFLIEEALATEFAASVVGIASAVTSALSPSLGINVRAVFVAITVIGVDPSLKPAPNVAGYASTGLEGGRSNLNITFRSSSPAHASLALTVIRHRITMPWRLR